MVFNQLSTLHEGTIISWQSLARTQPASPLSVEVRNGLVTITGTVNSLHKKAEVLRCVAEVAGVKEIDCRILVVPEKTDDATIKRKITEAISGPAKTDHRSDEFAWWQLFE